MERRSKKELSRGREKNGIKRLRKEKESKEKDWMKRRSKQELSREWERKGERWDEEKN